MFDRGRLVFIAISLLTVALLVSGSLMAASNRQNPDDSGDSPYRYLSVFMEVFGLVNKAYVDEPETDGLISGALEGTLDALDPFSLYIPAAALEEFEATRSVGTRHSGMVVLKERGVVYVAMVMEGSPAAEAGIVRGDILTTVGGRPTRESPLYEIQALLAAKPGTEIEIELLRLGQKSQIAMTLGEYERPAVVLETHEGIAVLRVPGFFSDTYENVASSLVALSKGAEALPGLETPEKLLVDLRGVSGGDEAVAYRVASLFASGRLGVLRDRSENLETFDSAAAATYTGTVAVLVDRGTQGPGEILAAVLRGSASAALIGEPTFGHSGRQNLVKLSDGGRLQITGAFFTGPDAEPIDEGLDPDVRIRVPFAAADDEDETEAEPADVVLDRGVKFLLEDEEVEREIAA